MGVLVDAVLVLDAQVWTSIRQRNVHGLKQRSSGFQTVFPGEVFPTIKESRSSSSVDARLVPGPVPVHDEPAVLCALKGYAISPRRYQDAEGPSRNLGDDLVVVGELTTCQQPGNGPTGRVGSSADAALVQPRLGTHNSVASYGHTTSGEAYFLVQALRTRGTVSNNLGEGGVDVVTFWTTMQLAVCGLSHESFPDVEAAAERHVIKGRALFLTGVAGFSIACLETADPVARGRPTTTTRPLEISLSLSPRGSTEALSCLVG